MAAFGKVLDLFDDRYLNLQDVTGNVEPLPTLVPYDEYTQNVLVYRMDTNHEIFMGLIQDFTTRNAQETGKEMWSWCTQWEVESRDPGQVSTPKKPRLDLSQPSTLSNPRPQRRAHAITVFERRALDSELMKEEDMLRILIDIVQTDSSLVPNFIEFLYRWIDFYEGDGKALKAALKWEIPSLWDFEYHPLVLPDTQKQAMNEKTDNEGPSKNKEAEELAQSSPTKKMREKPDLAAMERKIGESERLQYREVRYGIQPPRLEQPVPPLINIPRDMRKRQKYYAACFRSRQRALALLLEAGITSQQVANYKKLQKQHPKETSQDEEGNGMRHYNKDAKYAQCEFELKEKQMLLRAKQTEISISNKLALEASLASRNAVAEGMSGVPLIPPTPTYSRRPDIAAAILRRIDAMRRVGEERIGLVPAPLVGKLKSRLFEGARAIAAPPRRPHWDSSDGTRATNLNQGSESEADHSGDEDTDMDDSEVEDEHGDGDGNLLNSNNNPVFQHNHQTLAHNTSPAPADIAEYMRNLTPEQARSLVPLLNQNTRQAMANAARFEVSGGRALVSANTSLPNPYSQMASPTQPSSSIQPLSAGQFGYPMIPSLAVPPHPPPLTMATPQLPSSHTQGFEVGLALQAFQSHFSQPSLSTPQLPGFFRPALDGLPQSPAASNAQSFSTPIVHMASGQNITVQPFNAPLHTPQSPARIAFDTEEFLAPRRQQTAYGQVNAFFPAHGAPSTSVQQSPRPAPFSTLGNLLPTHSPMVGPPHLPLPQTLLSQPPHVRLPYNSPQYPNFSPSRPGIQRNAPSPLNLPPPPLSPLSSLAPSMLATSPFAASSHGIPIQVYLPKVIIQRVKGNDSTITPSTQPTDVLLLGHTYPGSGKIVLSKAIFLSTSVWTNTLRRVRVGAYTILETYSRPRLSFAPFPNTSTSTSPHLAIYTKLADAYSLMSSSNDRENDLTKRWRCTRGPMTTQERGAVWEGWAAVLEQGIEMTPEDRKGAVVSLGIIGGVVEGYGGNDGEEDRRRKEAEELMNMSDNNNGDGNNMEE